MKSALLHWFNTEWLLGSSAEIIIQVDSAIFRLHFMLLVTSPAHENERSEMKIFFNQDFILCHVSDAHNLQKNDGP